MAVICVEDLGPTRSELALSGRLTLSLERCRMTAYKLHVCRRLGS